MYRLICKGTIEERILQRAREKSEIHRMVIQGGSFKGKGGDLKPKEVVSLLLDDDEIEKRVRMKVEEEAILVRRMMVGEILEEASLIHINTISPAPFCTI